MSDKVCKCLDRQLETSVTFDENISFLEPGLFVSYKDTDCSTSCEANATEDCLVERCNVHDSSETRGGNAVECGACFWYNEVSVAEVFS